MQEEPYYFCCLPYIISIFTIRLCIHNLIAMNRVFLPLLFTIFTLLLISKENFAQFIPKEKPQEVASMSRFYWESSFGLQIGGITNVEISPALGYTLVKNFSAGVGISYIFYQNNYYVPAYRTNIFGGSTYLRHQIIDRFFLT